MADYKKVISPVKKTKNPITGPGKYVMRNGNAVTLEVSEKFPRSFLGSNGMYYTLACEAGNFVFGEGSESAEDIVKEWS